MSGQDTRCAICGEHAEDAALLADCFDCGVRFHLNPYSNRPGIDCGDAVIGETLGVHFYCNRCLAERQRAATAAEAGGPHAQAAAMLRALHGDALPTPPPSPEPTPPRARRRAGPPGRTPVRRRYRRIDR